MKKDHMKKESPFEQAGGQNQGSKCKQQATDPRILSELMNPSNMNYFGATFNFSEL